MDFITQNMYNSSNNYSSRHDNLCKSVHITVLNVTGIETQEPQQYCLRVNFPREELEYMSPKIKSTGLFNLNTSLDLYQMKF